MKKSRHHRRTERGNIFLFILMGIVLFAALSFTIARGFRSDNTGRMTQRDAVLAATDILSYTQKLENAVSKLRRKSVSENDISFAHSSNTGYTNPDCADDSCRVFSISGGGANWQTPPQGAASTWLFTGATCITDLGTGDATCADSGDSTGNEELIVTLSDDGNTPAAIDQTLCETINERLNITPMPADNDGLVSTAKYTGAFTNDTRLDITDSPRTACYSQTVSGTTSYYFYAVLMER